MADLVTISIEHHVADVRLNRPEKYNSLSIPMFKAIIEAGESLMKENTVRAVVLSGNGKGFCAGLDFDNFQKMDSASPDNESDSFSLYQTNENSAANMAQYAAWVWRQVPVPVIVALHGVAFGGGLQIALGTDIRLAKPDVRLSVMEIKWGLIPDMTASQSLRDLVRLDVAKDLTFTGRIVDGREAEKIGLITRICDDPLAEAFKLAKEIASKSPHAIRSGKQLLQENWHGDEATGLRREEKVESTLIATPNQIEAIMANFEKREPNFQDPE